MKLKIIPMTGWSATRLFSWEQCPLRAQLQYAQNLCTICFKGQVAWEGACSRCGKTPEKPEPLARGIRIGAGIDGYIRGTEAKQGEEAKQHQAVSDLIKNLRQAHRRGVAKVLSELQIKLDKKWRPVGQYVKSWVNGRLDVLWKLRPKYWKVIDWKTGGIDKMTKEIKQDDNYSDQLELYGVLTLSAYPEVEEVQSSLIFLDAPASVNPEVSMAGISRDLLEKRQRRWEGRVKPMLTDTVFPPRPGWYCGWMKNGIRQGCPYEKQKGGPCPL